MNEIQEALRKKYSDVHPLIFQKMLEKSKTNGELFDMLESLPKSYPIVWDENEKNWVSTSVLESMKNETS